MMHGHNILIAILILVLAGQSLLAQTADEMFALAAGHYQRTEWAECADIFQRLAGTYPESARVPDAYFYLGESRVQLGQWEEARAAFQNFLVRQTNHIHAEKATFRIAEIAYLQADEHGANLCEGFLRDYPQSEFQPFAISYLGQLRLRRDEPQLAQRVFERALLDFPQHPLADDNRVGLATALARLGLAEEGKRFLTHVAHGRSDSLGQRARLQLAVIDVQQGHTATAVGQLVEVTACRSLELNYLAEAHVWLARCHAALGNDDAAVVAYESALQLGVPKNWAATINLECSLAMLRSNQHDPAKTKLRSIVKRWPSHDSAEAALATLARLFYEHQQLDEARDCTTTYLKQYPTGVNLNLMREINGRIAYDRKDYSQSEMEFAFLLTTLPKDTRLAATYQYLHALSLVGLENFTLGADELQRISLDDLPTGVSGGYHLTLGSALFACGKLEDACSEYEKCLAGSTTSEEMATKARREMLSVAIQLDRPELVHETWFEISQANESTVETMVLAERVADFAYRHRDWDLAS
jgi:TolA-binding protein